MGDFNGDGESDLVVNNSGNGTVSVLLGHGDGTFSAAVSYAAGSGPQSIAVADFNGDGKVDLAVANNASGTVSVLLGRGDGTFNAAVSYAAGNGPASLAVGDFNGDGIVGPRCHHQQWNYQRGGGASGSRYDGTLLGPVSYRRRQRVIHFTGGGGLQRGWQSGSGCHQQRQWQQRQRALGQTWRRRNL